VPVWAQTHFPTSLGHRVVSLYCHNYGSDIQVLQDHRMLVSSRPRVGILSGAVFVCGASGHSGPRVRCTTATPKKVVFVPCKQTHSLGVTGCVWMRWSCHRVLLPLLRSRCCSTDPDPDHCPAALALGLHAKQHGGQRRPPIGVYARAAIEFLLGAWHWLFASDLLLLVWALVWRCCVSQSEIESRSQMPCMVY
jgi:hypothetical protein